MFSKYTPRRVSAALGIGVAICLASFHSAALAQTDAFSASLSGAVHDSSGAAVPGAKVSLSSREKGISRTFTTDGEGRYSFAILPPATYTLSIEATGFSTFREENITLAAGQASSEAITLQVGQVQTEVTVSGVTAPLLTTDNANVSSDLNQTQITQLPWICAMCSG